MSRSRFVVASIAVPLFLALAGCSGAGAEKAGVAGAESELNVSETRFLGAIQSGETKTETYDAPPEYRAYGFDAKGGDEVIINVQSVGGDGVGWITDDSYDVLAFNDDASDSALDAKVKYTVPAGQPARAYRIVFRDYKASKATVKVTLSIFSTTPATCTYAGQIYQSGDEFEAVDGCNTCICAATGDVACATNACACDPASEPHHHYVGTSEQCMVIRYTCLPDQVPFSNGCGCGCETKP